MLEQSESQNLDKRTLYHQLLKHLDSSDFSNIIYRHIVASVVPEKIIKRNTFSITNDNGHKNTLRGIVSVGRSSHCDITVKNNSISRINCMVVHCGSCIYIVDLWSRHGTTVIQDGIEDESHSLDYKLLKVQTNQPFGIKITNRNIVWLKGN